MIMLKFYLQCLFLAMPCFTFIKEHGGVAHYSHSLLLGSDRLKDTSTLPNE